jgi:predicted ester cyclase
MTREEIVQLFARRAESFAALDAKGVASSHAEDCVFESPLAGRLVGRQAIEQFYQSLFTSFSDFAFEQTDLLIDGDRAVQIGVVSGTNDGGFMGLPPTRKRFNFAVVLVCTLRGGFIVAERFVYDFTGWMVQLGILKAKPL